MDKSDTLQLSDYADALIKTIEAIPSGTPSPHAQKINVSQTVSFFALLYERVRNSIEFREEHLVRRAAIERIIKRRLTLNPQGHSEGENLIRELLWARYLPSDFVTEKYVQRIQAVIDKYLLLRKEIIASYGSKLSSKEGDFMYEIMTAEIEEHLNPDITAAKSAYLYFFYQVLHNKVIIKDVTEATKDSYFYVACEQAYLKNDTPYIRHHLFTLSHAPISSLDEKGIQNVARKWKTIVADLDALINNPYSEKLARFAKKHVPPFLILYELINRERTALNQTLTSINTLKEKVEEICQEKYMETRGKLRNAAVRSIIYIFLTKMVFVLALELPLTKYVYKEVHYMPLIINSLFPPLLMGLIVSFFSPPSHKNTEKIFDRIVNILDRDSTFEESKAVISYRPTTKRPILLLGFSSLYIVTFSITFALIYVLLDMLSFNFISKAIFVFFVTVVTFFGYRIRQTAKEYSLEERERFFTPIIHFLFLPILSVGKILSREVAKLNVLMLLFDFFIEAPFKVIFDVVEEWVSFVKARKEEIV